MSAHRFALTVVGALVCAWGCAEGESGSSADGPVEADAIDGPAVVATNQVDILFVVDNSGSMREEQVNLGRNFAVFMNELASLPGGDFQIRTRS